VYEELTKARSELKTIQTRAFEENQQLAQQLANAKCVCVCVSVCMCCQPPHGWPGMALQSISIANGSRPFSDHIETRVLQSYGPCKPTTEFILMHRTEDGGSGLYYYLWLMNSN